MSETSNGRDPGVPRAGDGRGGIGARNAALSGGVVGGAGIASAELLAGLVPGVSSPAIAVGSLIIDLQPAGAKDLMISLFGTNDKAALNLGVVVGALLVASLLGLIARRDHRPGWDSGLMSLNRMRYISRGAQHCWRPGIRDGRASGEGCAILVPLRRTGVADSFGESGTAHELLEFHHLTSEHIVAAALTFIGAR